MKFRAFYIFVFIFFAFGQPASAMDVFVSIAPQKWLSDSLGGSLVTTHILVGEGQDPHTFEPTPKQMTTLSKARLYFTLDLEFEHRLEKKLSSSMADLKFVDTAHHVKKIQIAEHDHEEEAHGHAEEHHHEESAGHETLDPHIWLSVINLKIIANEMTKAFIDVDPANTTTYQSNLDTLIQKLDKLHDNITQELAPYAGQRFYVFHPSFGYFAHDYKLQQKAVEISGKSPSPRQLSQLIGQAKKDKIKVIFVQPQFDVKSARAIAGAIDGEVVPLNPLAEDVTGNLEVMMVKIKAALAR